jgi:prepilin signal peptidase PulO-like enzyme (type II secretory pathway)
MGLVLGPWQWYVAISVACVLGVIGILLLKKKFGIWRPLPFIPFMGVGGIAVYLVEGKM